MVLSQNRKSQEINISLIFQGLGKLHLENERNHADHADHAEGRKEWLETAHPVQIFSIVFICSAWPTSVYPNTSGKGRVQKLNSCFKDVLQTSVKNSKQAR